MITQDMVTLRLQPKGSQAYLDLTSLEKFRHDRTLSTASMLAALSKQMRQEVRTSSWSQISVTVDVQLPGQAVYGPTYFRLLTAFLLTIGRNGRAALTKLKMIGTSLRYEYESPRRFGALKHNLQQCSNLRELELCLSIDVLLGDSSDLDALQAYSLGSKALSSPSLNGIVGFFQGFHNLRLLKLHTAPDRRSNIVARRQRDDEDFFQFAFTGNREKRLIQEIRDQLRSLEVCRLKSSAAGSTSMTMRNGKNDNLAARVESSERSFRRRLSPRS